MAAGAVTAKLVTVGTIVDATAPLLWVWRVGKGRRLEWRECGLRRHYCERSDSGVFIFGEPKVARAVDFRDGCFLRCGVSVISSHVYINRYGREMDRDGGEMDRDRI